MRARARVQTPVLLSFLVTVICSLLAFSAAAQPEEILVSELPRSLDLRDRALVYRDTTGGMTIEEVQALKENGQMGNGVQSISRLTEGIPTSFWFYFRVRNDTDAVRQLAYYLPYDRVDIFDSYTFHSDGRQTVEKVGFFRPISPSLSTNWFPFVPLDLGPGDTVEVYARIGGAVYLHLPLKLSNLNIGLRTIHEHYVVYGIIFGTMLAAIAYLSVLWPLVPGRYIPLLIGFIFAGLSYAFVGSGITRDIWGFFGDDATRILITLAVAGLFIFGMSFARSFLDMRANLPLMDTLFGWFMIPCALTVFYSLFDPPAGHFLISTLSPIGVLLSIIAGVRAIQKQVPGAKPYFLSYTAVTVGGFVGNAIDLGMVPANQYTSYVMFASFAVCGLALSMTVANRIRQRQAQADARLKAVFNTSLSAIVTVDKDGIVLDYNEAAERMFGVPRTRVLGEDIAPLFLTDEGMRLHEDIFLPRSHDPDLLEDFMGRPAATTMRRGDGTEFPVEVAVTSAEANGEFFYSSQIRDMSSVREMETELEAKREELFQSEKLAALGSLLAGVAHELNNPLSVVIGRASMLRDLSPDEKVKTSGEKILDAAQRCARIIRSFLAMARQRPIQKEPANLNTIVESAVELVGYNVKKESVDLTLDLDKELPDTDLDADQITQVAVNLIINSCQAMGERDEQNAIRVSTGYLSRGDQVVLTVEDNGPGVPEDIRKRVFDPFFTTKEVGQGTGLGLSVAQGMIEAHGGTLSLSESVLGGACFRIMLPRHAPPDGDADGGTLRASEPVKQAEDVAP